LNFPTFAKHLNAIINTINITHNLTGHESQMTWYISKQKTE